MKLSGRFISAGVAKCELTSWVPAPYLRKTVTVDSDLKKAELSVCGLGFYRFWLDGVELTHGHMSPYITNPDKILDYDIYDLTGKLTKGEHVLGFQLGNGMQNCFGGYFWSFDHAAWRSAPKLAVCLALTAQDDTVTEMEADESFVCAPSPIRFDDIRQGEVYDANQETDGWNTVGFDDSAWTPAIAAELPRGRAKACEANPIVATGERKPKLIGRHTLRYARSEHVDEGYLYDFGVNAAGLCRLTVKGKKGQEIGMIFGEYRKENGEFTVDNLRFDIPQFNSYPLYHQQDIYICKGEGTESWTPAFTYHGFRYVLVTGITEEQATESLLTYVVMNTDLPERGGFSCSDDKLNRFQSMVRVATLANFYHFPTDCPHREKNGWTADAALSAEHTLLNLDPENNYSEWIQHICAAMDEKGAVPGIVPTGGWGFSWGNGPAWDQVLVILPYYLYRYRGNKDVVRKALPYLLRYVNYLTTRTDDKGLIGFGLGDWCAPYEPRSPQNFTDSVISMSICEKSAFLFEECGQKAQADFCRTVAGNLRKAIRANLIDFSTMTAVGCNSPFAGSETSQAMAIWYNVFTDEEKPTAFRVLLEKIAEQNDHLDTGVLGARIIFHLLSDYGYSDLAYKILVDPTYPSYGTFLVRGETAMPEDFRTEAQGITSRNHHFFGDISGWFIKDICGIHFNPTAKDIREVVLKPHFLSALEHAEAYHICPDGKISVKWEKKGDKVVLTVTVPETLHGRILFPDGWKCAECGKTETEAASGIYTLIR